MIRVGICSWTEKTLIQSREFYPPSAKIAEARLRFYAQHFDVVEVDSSYYAIPAMQTAGLWAERTPQAFTFHIKAFAGLTGHGVDPRSLPADLQDLLTLEQRKERHVYLKDLAQIAAVAERFRQNLHPLAATGKLGVLVYQYPPWFQYSHRNLDHIVACKNLMAGLPLAVEFRHGSWLVPERREGVLSFLRDNGLHYVTADEPQFGDLRTVPYLPGSTGDIAYIRFHGRNRENWFRKGIETALRYAYEYSDEELRGFVPSIRDVAEKTKVTYVMFNNCYMASAIKNALRMKELVKK
jgi:uncharacterized protein YecE (DUF72 family)